MGEQVCEYTKIIHSKVNFMVYEVCINKAIKCKQNKTQGRRTKIKQTKIKKKMRKTYKQTNT